jgi:hypothetical protein
MASWTIGPDTFATVWQGRAVGWRTSLAMVARGAALALAAAALTALTLAGTRPLGGLTVVAVVLLAAGALLCLCEAAAACLTVTRVSLYSVRIRPGLIPLVGMRIPVRIISAARVIEAPPRRAYDWGWWWGRRIGSVLVRPGACLALDLGSRGEVLISVDRPEVAAQVIRRVTPPNIR